MKYLRELRERGEDIISYLEQMVYKGNPLYEYIEFKILEFGDGIFKVSFPYKKELCRIGGSIHGGIIMTAIDHACGMAVLSVNEGRDQVTVELKVNFIKPLLKGPFTAIGKVVKKGRRIVIAEGEIYDANKELCALGMGTWYLIYE
jgi:acyl-CoA thioesterase